MIDDMGQFNIPTEDQLREAAADMEKAADIR